MPVGGRILVDGDAATVQMETATQVLVRHVSTRHEEWVPKSSGRLAMPTEGGASVALFGGESSPAVIGTT